MKATWYEHLITLETLYKAKERCRRVTVTPQTQGLRQNRVVSIYKLLRVKVEEKAEKIKMTQIKFKSFTAHSQLKSQRKPLIGPVLGQYWAIIVSRNTVTIIGTFEKVLYKPFIFSIFRGSLAHPISYTTRCILHVSNCHSFVRRTCPHCQI